MPSRHQGADPGIGAAHPPAGMTCDPSVSCTVRRDRTQIASAFDGLRGGQKRSPTISSLLAHSASACSGSSAYARTPSLPALISPSVTSETWQFSQ